MQRFQKTPNTHPQESDWENQLATRRSFSTIMVSKQWGIGKEGKKKNIPGEWTKKNCKKKKKNEKYAPRK